MTQITERFFEELNDTDNDDENDYTIKITGDLGSLKKQCEEQEASGEELRKNVLKMNNLDHYLPYVGFFKLKL